LASPCATLNAALAAASGTTGTSHVIYVAGGTIDDGSTAADMVGPTTSIYGAFLPDFSARDLTHHASTLTSSTAGGGTRLAPRYTLGCNAYGIAGSSVVDGLTVAAPGGSHGGVRAGAVVYDNCSALFRRNTFPGSLGATGDTTFGMIFVAASAT